VMGPLVYGKSRDIFGHTVNRSRSAGRTMWWVPHLQR
jgi:hypothetical protein